MSLSKAQNAVDDLCQGLVGNGAEGAIVQGQSSVRRKAEMYAKKARLKVIKLHEFRHSCGSNLPASGLSVRVVARWVGDTECMVQDTYSHLLPSEKEVIKDFFDGLEEDKDR